MKDGYEMALEAAGATVHCYETFGSYQGDWWARVTRADGQSGWIHAYYGSCSGCDAFEAAFGYDDHDECGQHVYSRDEAAKAACANCQRVAAAYRAKLSAFGAEYLENLLTAEQAIAMASENLQWDMDAQRMVDYIIAHEAKFAADGPPCLDAKPDTRTSGEDDPAPQDAAPR